MKRKPKFAERFLLILHGILVIAIIGYFFIAKAFAYEKPIIICEVESSEYIPFSQQIEYDLDIKYQEWCLIHELKEQEEDTAPEYLIDVTQEDIDLMARVVMSEASVLCADAKQAIAQTIVNRVRTDYREFRNQNTVSDVVFYPNAYSTQDNGEPNEECYEAVYAALMYEGFPTDMFWFREDHYHRFGTDYINIGSTYFTRLGK